MSIRFSDVFYVYNPKSPLESKALSGVNLEIEKGGFTALVGRTGCGKSTLVQHINSLLHPTSGEIDVDGFKNVPEKKKRSKGVSELRKKVGLVFQFPEYQLFEETVEKDVSFGPRNFGMDKEEALKAAHEALLQVGLDESFFTRSPFDLSGGEKRRVALAGIIAIKPDVLIVDEPTAGLDPRGSKEIMDLFRKIHESGTTLILVSHDMDIVLEYAEQVIVMDDGKIAFSGKPEELFGQEVEAYSLDTPLVYSYLSALKKKGLDIDPKAIRNVKELAKAIKEAIR